MRRFHGPDILQITTGRWRIFPTPLFFYLILNTKEIIENG